MLVATRLLSIPAAALLLATGSAVDRIAFHAEEGTSVVRTFEFEIDQELSAIEITVNGQDIPPEYLEGVEASLSDTDRVVVTDEFGSLLDGRPATLRRTFEELSGLTTESSTGPEGEIDESTAEKSSPLEGSTVLFTWDDDEQEYSAEFEDGGDEDLLDELVEDMDLRGFLPEDSVDEGDSWEPGIEAFKALLDAGGDLHLRADDEERSEVDEQLDENIDGDVRVTYAGVRSEDGVEVAVLEIEVSAESQGEGVEEDDDGIEAQMTMTIAFELEGELTWDIAAGHLHGLELTGSLDAEMTNVTEMDGEGEMMEFIQEMSFEGTVAFTVSVEAQ